MDMKLQSKHINKTCLFPDCHGKVTLYLQRSHERRLPVYTSSGTKYAQHIESRCSSCRRGYYHGYRKDGTTYIYDDDAWQNDFLISSRETGFEVNYLNHCSLLQFYGDISVVALTDTYNAFHLTEFAGKGKDSRAKLYEKRLTEALLLFEVLELKNRYGLSEMAHGSDVDESILQHFDKIKAKFEENWAKHSCGEEGCGRVLTIDGDLKLTRCEKHYNFNKREMQI